MRNSEGLKLGSIGKIPYFRGPQINTSLLFFFGRCILERALVLMYGERIYTFSMFSFASDFNSEPDRFSF
jgi:hypothetical protein